ncbi:MAG: hypothetical protein MZV65_33835 [Chromatiales bacterium]|nr:hypothetical protein [Chromatiales bacterium]
MLPLCFGQATKACRRAARGRPRPTARASRLGVGDRHRRCRRCRSIETPPGAGARRRRDSSGRSPRFAVPSAQVPPMYSATQARRAAALRAGARGVDESSARARPITIHAVDAAGRWTATRLECRRRAAPRAPTSAVLAEEIAAALGTAAHVVELRRAAGSSRSSRPPWSRSRRARGLSPSGRRTPRRPAGRVPIGALRRPAEARPRRRAARLHLCQGRAVGCRLPAGPADCAARLRAAADVLPGAGGARRQAAGVRAQRLFVPRRRPDPAAETA